MGKTFNFYCDESTHLQNDNKPFMIISYVSSAYNELDQHKECLKNLKLKHNCHGEVKWSNTSFARYQYYADLIDYFFSSDLNFRAVIIDKKKIDESREGFSYDEFYFKMYYQLLHHKINMGYHYNIYLDIMISILVHR